MKQVSQLSACTRAGPGAPQLKGLQMSQKGYSWTGGTADCLWDQASRLCITGNWAQLGPQGWRPLQQAGQASQDLLLQFMPFDFGMLPGRQLLQSLWQPQGGLKLFEAQADAAVPAKLW